MGIFSKKNFQGRTRPFRFRSLYTPATPLQGLMLHVFKWLTHQFDRIAVLIRVHDPDFF